MLAVQLIFKVQQVMIPRFGLLRLLLGDLVVLSIALAAMVDLVVALATTTQVLLLAHLAKVLEALHLAVTAVAISVVRVVGQVAPQLQRLLAQALRLQFQAHQ